MHKISCILLLLLWVVVSSSQVPQQHVSIELSADQQQVTGGQQITVAITQNITPKWHVYWINPGDSGEATTIDWSGLPGLFVADIQWPIPHKIPLGPLTNYGYENQVTLLQKLTLPEALPQGPIELVADISLLVCEEICIPEFHTASLVLNGAEAGDPKRIQWAQNHLPLSQDWPTSYHLNGNDVVLNVSYDADLLALDQVSEVALFFKTRGLVNNSATASTEFNAENWLIKQTQGDILASEVPETQVVLVYTDPSGQRNGIELKATYRKAMVTAPETSWWAAIGLALLGGLILNVMPCVFPVLALKALSLVRLQSDNHSKAQLHGWAYTLGILLSFMVIAGMLIGFKTAGAQMGWGFQLQNPLFVMFLIYLLALVGLNLAGYFEIGSSWSNLGSSMANQSGLAGSFYTGVLATLVATPCTAPFMGVAIGYALVQPIHYSLTVFVALGFGLALPYLVLASFPKTRTWLPKPGPWMEWFKEFLAFPMFATAAWLIWVLSVQTGSQGVLVVLMGLVLLAFGLWILRAQSKISWLGLLVLLSALWPFYSIHRSSLQADSAQNWQPFTAADYNAALERSDPVFINMTAAWCITCQVNEQVALDTANTRALFEQFNIQYFKGDWTDFDADITRYLEQYNRNGVPIYVYYGRKDERTGQRPDPQVLPQILTQATIKRYVANEKRD